MHLALLDPEVGYYSAKRTRVGRSAGTDFYTASSLGPLFGRLVAASASALIENAGWSADEATFVELGAEPGTSVLNGTDHPFSHCTQLGLEVAENLPDALEELGRNSPLVVFSNELFDAQPVERWVREAGTWRETGVHLPRDGDKLEFRFTKNPPPSWIQLDPMLQDLPDGWILDAPRAATSLLSSLTLPNWRGAFIAFDYGLDWAALARERPEGTLRAYSRHRLEADLLADPGQRDLTAHVCWDWLASALLDAGFQSVGVKSQEAFLVHHAGAELERVVSTAAAFPASGHLRTLQELLHPARMGSKFQVLSGWRCPLQFSVQGE